MKFTDIFIPFVGGAPSTNRTLITLCKSMVKEAMEKYSPDVLSGINLYIFSANPIIIIHYSFEPPENDTWMEYIKYLIKYQKIKCKLFIRDSESYSNYFIEALKADLKLLGIFEGNYDEMFASWIDRWNKMALI